MINLNLPDCHLNILHDGKTTKVFDPLRKKYVRLSPEEFVRQRFCAWMMTSLGYPPSLMANETGIELNGTKRRCDTVVFNPNGGIIMIVEYKAPAVRITQGVFDQIARYNMVLDARCLAVSNGLQHYCCIMEKGGAGYRFLPEVPSYSSLLS